MVSAATGAMALLLTTLVAEHGLQYLFAATLVTAALVAVMIMVSIGTFNSTVLPCTTSRTPKN